MPDPRWNEYVSLSLTQPRVQPAGWHSVAASTTFILPAWWRIRTSPAGTGFSALITRPGSRCRHTLRVTSRIIVGTDQPALELARSLVPAPVPRQILLETTSSRIIPKAVPIEEASRIVFDANVVKASAALTVRLGPALRGSQTWLIYRFASSPNDVRSCGRDRLLTFRRLRADLSSAIAGSRTFA